MIFTASVNMFGRIESIKTEVFLDLFYCPKLKFLKKTFYLVLQTEKTSRIYLRCVSIDFKVFLSLLKCLWILWYFSNVFTIITLTYQNPFPLSLFPYVYFFFYWIKIYTCLSNVIFFHSSILHIFLIFLSVNLILLTPSVITTITQTH